MTDTAGDVLLEMVRQLKADFAAERKERRDEAELARQSRAKTHERMDEIVDRVGRIDTSIALAGEIDAQVRAELDEMKKAVAAVTPTAEEWGRVKRIGKWAATAVLAGGVGIGAFVAAMGDRAVDLIRHWLRIP